MKDPSEAGNAAEILLKPAKLRDVAVGSAELKSLSPVEDHKRRTHDRAVIEIRWSASVDGAEAAFDVHNFELARAADAPQHAKFKRGLCSLDCPECGGQLTTSDAVTCTYCGTKLSGGKQEWALYAVRKGELPPEPMDEGGDEDEGGGSGSSGIDTGLAIGAVIAGAALGALTDSSDEDQGRSDPDQPCPASQGEASSGQRRQHRCRHQPLWASGSPIRPVGSGKNATAAGTCLCRSPQRGPRQEPPHDDIVQARASS